MTAIVRDLLGETIGISPIRFAMQVVGLILCAAIACFIVFTTAFGRLPPPAQYSTVLSLGLAATFLLRPGPLARHPRLAAWDLLLSLVLTAIGVFAGVYVLLNYAEIAEFREGLPNTIDLWAYGLGTLAVLFAAHRVEGWLLVSVVLGATGYLMFGHYLPGIFQHRAFDLPEVLEVSFSYQGVLGVAFGAVVDVVYVFIVLGVALRVTGVGEFFNHVAQALTQGRRSGPAQCAIIASTLFGSINGSAPANVAATGVLTIPLMKRAGYPASLAGATEATASCVGQIMPPVMGVGAFIMSDITGIPYVDIMAAAIVPALLFVLSLSITVGLEAGRLGLTPQCFSDVGWDRRRSVQALILVAGFGTLLGMLFAGFSPTYCGLVATAVVIGLAMIVPQTRLGPREWIVLLVDSGRDGLNVGMSCAAIGVVIGAVTTTGLGIKINQLIIMLGGHHLVLALALAAVCSIILGMGLPTAASYLMVIFVAGPAIMDLGVGILQTHLFVFYYAVLSAITPPVALAVFAAAAIAKETPIPVALKSMRLCIVGFVLPMAWIYHPEIMLNTLTWQTLPPTLWFIGCMVAAVVAVSAAHVGYFRRRLLWIERLVLATAAVLVVIDIPWTETGGILIVTAALTFIATVRVRP